MNRTKVFLTAILILALMSTFIALGFWQLDRARSLKELQKPYQELPIVSLSDIANTNSNLADESVNRIVTFTGRYVAEFDAPNQRDKDGRTENWLVGLMEVDGGGAILVVRSNQNSEIPKGNISVTGRLLPRQFEDRSEKLDGQLSRLDPSLVSALYPDNLYDGFVVANSELVDGKEVVIPRISVAPARPTVPGYYWQHLSYVVIWWLMALVVLFMPFYSRWRSKQ